MAFNFELGEPKASAESFRLVDLSTNAGPKLALMVHIATGAKLALTVHKATGPKLAITVHKVSVVRLTPVG